MAEKVVKQAHFVMVHGQCHGAWSWYKVKPRLEAAGHRVTVLDMAASGIHPKSIRDVHNFQAYAQPLMEFMASADERVTLVGHSFGGMSLALAMEMFPEKISAAFFVTALMPDTRNRPSHVLHKFLDQFTSEAFLDSKFEPHGEETLVLFGHKYLTSNIYHLSPQEDIELAMTLLRPGSFFEKDLSKAKIFSDGAYGLVKRVYVICGKDKIISEELQRWMIEIFPVDQVVEMKSSDHMPMFSEPQELCDRLIQIADLYV